MARQAPPPVILPDAPNTNRGRPPIYDNAFCDLAFKFCLLGATNDRLAELFGVTTTCIEQWLRNHEGFFRAVHDGRDKADAEVAYALYHRAKGYDHRAVKIFCNPTTGQQEIIEYNEHWAPDVRAAQYWLNNRRRQEQNWSDTQKKEISGADGSPLFASADGDDRARRNRQLLMEQVAEGD